jgi:hypothetical protein
METFTVKGELSRTEPNRTEPSRTELYVCSVYTSSGILTAYSILIAPRRSGHVMSRRCSRADWRFALVVSLSSHRVLCEVRITYVQGLARRFRPQSHYKPSQVEQIRIEPIRFGLENQPTLLNGSIHTSRRTEPSRTDPDRAWPSVFSGRCLS